MFSTNPANWVTFEDEPLFQSPQKTGGSHNVFRTNGLKLLLPKMHDSSSQSSSSSNISLSSPMNDYYFIPGPPSNSPLCTPTRDYPASPCFPKTGSHPLYPIPELSSSVNIHPAPQKLDGILQTESSVPKPADDVNTTQENLKKLEDCSETQIFFQYVQNNCAFSSPFWTEDSPSSSSGAPRKDSGFGKDDCSLKEKEGLPDQKSLNQGSFNYICERLEHLQTGSSDNERTLTSMPCIYTGDGISPFIPPTLFSSQRKDGWPFMLRIPEKKNMMSSRQWGPIYLRVLPGGILQMYYEKGLEKPFKEFQLHPFCRLSEPKLENCSISGRLHTVKIEYVSYTEKKKYHPKAEVIHEPEIEQMLKLGTTDYSDFTDFLMIVEEELMKLPVPSKPKKHYEEQEIVLELVDNFWGRITKAEAKLVESVIITHVYYLSFVNGNSECFLTLNDLELERRDEDYFEKDTEKKWIEILDYHFHQCAKQQEFEQSRIIKFTPTDGCRLELMRFRTRYNGSDLPFFVKALVVAQGACIELQAFINMSSSALASVHSHSMKHCESIMIHFPVPPQWIKTLWTMNLQRQKSLKAKMNRRACLGSLTEIESDSVIQVSIGTAKYESAYRAIVWKIDRLPDKNTKKTKDLVKPPGFYSIEPGQLKQCQAAFILQHKGTSRNLRDSKLTMLLRESLGNMNCRTTMIAHISAAAGNYAETLSTIQIASRVLRMKKKKTKYTSSSSGGESSCEEGRMRRPTQLRPFHSRNAVDPDFPILHLSSDPDYSSSSEQSCDTVIYVGPNGTALSDKELTDNEGPPDFVPIVPALQKTRNEGKLDEVTETAPNTSERDCLKCNTFAELQERLDCIDGSEETDHFPFEELPVQFSSDQTTKCPLSSQVPELNDSLDPDREEDFQEPDKELTENLNTVPSNVQGGHSPVHSGMPNEISTPPSPRSVTGSPSSQMNSSQQSHCTDLQSSRESLNSCGFVETKPRSMGSPRLGIASLSKTSEYKPPTSPSQRCKVYTQKGVLPNPAPPPSSLSKDSGMVSSESLIQPDVCTPSIGMSPQFTKKSRSSSSGDYGETMDSVEQQQQSVSSETKKEILSTTMVTVQQPLELNGEDELVFTLVEELTISGVLENGRPTSIISFNSDCSVQALASGSRPVSIISSISEDLECYASTVPVSEVSITQFLPLPKMGPGDKAEEAESRRSSISSWLSEMSTGSDGEQSCHSFIAQACYGHGEAMAEAPVPELSKVEQNNSASCTDDGQKPMTEDIFLLPEVVDKTINKMSPIKGCKISALGKTTVTITNAANLSSCEGFIPMKTNITVYPCIAVNPFKAQETHEAVSAISSPAKTQSLQEVKEYNTRKEIKFDDPWLKRKDSVKKENGETKSETVPDKNMKQSLADRLSSSSGETSSSPGTENLKRIVDGCEMGLPSSTTYSPINSTDSIKNGSLTRGFQKASKQEELDTVSYHYTDENNAINSSVSCQTSKASLERRIASPKHCILTRPKGTPPLPPIRKSSLDQKNRASPQHSACSSSTSSPSNQPSSYLASFSDEFNSKQKNSCIENGNNSSSKLFSAKLEQLASRTNSLGRPNGSHYECLSLERAESLSSVRINSGKDTTMPRAGRSLNRSLMSSPTNSGISQSAGASPKASQSKISAVSKLLLASPKARSLAASTTKTLSFSTKSLPQSVGQSSSLPPNGKNMSWSTQSLSRSRNSGLSSKLPLRAVNGRISELLQGSPGTRGLQLRRNSDTDERGAIHGDEKPLVHLLPSPYSKITPPRKPHRCSSGHGSDNSSVLSGELPPAMGKTALFYHSGGSSGYESMMRDSEATGSASSAQDSMSENSSSVSGRCRSLKNPKKRSNTGCQRRRLIPALSLDATSPVRKPTSPAVRWVDGPLRSAQRGMGEPFEIKVYEIDDVERLQRRRTGDNNEVICFNAKLKILEHRQQRIAEVKAKYEWLMRELEVTKQYLMLDPNKWLSEFDLEQVFDLDSLEYLEALECVTERLENRVNYCKAHLMMITCFDITSRRR